MTEGKDKESERRRAGGKEEEASGRLIEGEVMSK